MTPTFLAILGLTKVCPFRTFQMASPSLSATECTMQLIRLQGSRWMSLDLAVASADYFASDFADFAVKDVADFDFSDPPIRSKMLDNRELITI